MAGLPSEHRRNSRSSGLNSGGEPGGGLRITNRRHAGVRGRPGHKGCEVLSISVAETAERFECGLVTCGNAGLLWCDLNRAKRRRFYQQIRACAHGPLLCSYSDDSRGFASDNSGMAYHRNVRV